MFLLFPSPLLRRHR